MRTIVVQDYDSAWPEQFEMVRRELWPAVSDFAVAIEHVGSTSVPGLAAKPILDIDIIVPSGDDVPLAIARLAALGYIHRGDLGVEAREAFRPPPGPPARHVYVCPQGVLSLRNHLALRDHLRNNRASAEAYGALKKKLADQFPHDIDGYLVGKTGFIRDILRACGFTEEECGRIGHL